MQYDSDRKSLSTAPGLHCSIPSSQLPSAVLQASTKGQLRQIQRETPIAFSGWLSVTFMHCLTEPWAISISQKEHTCFTATSSLPFWTTWYNLTKPFFIQFSCDSLPILMTVWKGMFWLLHYFMHCNSWTTFFRLMHPTTAALRLGL